MIFIYSITIFPSSYQLLLSARTVRTCSSPKLVSLRYFYCQRLHLSSRFYHLTGFKAPANTNCKQSSLETLYRVRSSQVTIRQFIRIIPSIFHNIKMPNEVTIEDLTTLKSPNVFIKDEATVLQKINKIIKDGANKLQLVTDFDLTLTKQHENGVPILSSFGIFRKCKQLPDYYKNNTKILYEKYRKIEIDPEIPLDEKIKEMNDWNMSAHEMLQGIPFDKKEIDEVTDIYGHSLRDRTKELFSKLNSLGVPILVFSAGLGDVVRALLKHQEVYMDNVNVISNFLKFNDNMLEGFENSHKLIHVFNKNEHAVENEYFKIIQGRTNVVLMGDTLGDATMADGVKDTETILRIGFLYDQVEKCLPSYKEAFDIVLVDDQTMNVVLDVLNPLF